MADKIQVFDIANELIIIPKAVIDEFLKHKNPADLIALYSFYYYTAKWQQTNQPKATTNYTSQGLHWSQDKVRRVKKQLIEIGLVKDVKAIDKKTHKITGWYIKVNYIFKRSTIDEIKPTLLEKPEGGNGHSVETEGTNALSSSSLNALSSSSLIPEKKFIIEIPLKDNSTFGVTEDHLNELKESFPSRDHITELRKMRQWCIDSPTRRKTKRGVRRFISGWLNRAPQVNNEPKKPKKSMYAAKEAYKQAVTDGDTTLDCHEWIDTVFRKKYEVVE